MLTNLKNIPVALAVWLVNDEYDYQTIPNYLSVTSLLKPIRQIILGSRIQKTSLSGTEDLEDLIPRALGQTIHAGIEHAWLTNHRSNLRRLGYPQAAVDRTLVNPNQAEIDALVSRGEAPVLVWVEQRATRKVGKWTIGGKFDLVIEGTVQDTKTLTTYAYIAGTRDDDYIMQGSLYRWLNQDKITEDQMVVNMVFTDWKAIEAKSDPVYPQCRAMSKTLDLKPVNYIEHWVTDRLMQLERYWETPESELPECPESELWMSEPVFKYYAKAETAHAGGRSTRNFGSLQEANEFRASKGGGGVVVPKPREAKRCGYCDAAPLCTQRLRYAND